MTIRESTRRVSDIATSAKRQFGDESGVQMTDSDIVRWVNEAQQEIGTILKPIKARSTSTTVIGQADYTLPVESAVQIESIHVNDVKIEGITFPQAEEQIFSQGVKKQVGMPYKWFEWGGTITLWPVPNSAVPLSIYYTRAPAFVESLTDLLTIPDKHYDSVMAYVMAKAYEMDEDFDAAQQQRQIFANRTSDQNEEERVSQHMTYSTITFIDE